MKGYYFPVALVISATCIGCNGTSTTETTNQTSEKTTQSNEPKVSEYQSSLPADAPTYKVATTGTQPPFTFKDEHGNIQGIDIDIMRLVGEKQGFKVEFYLEPWQNVFPSVVDGDRDVAISGISYNDERNEKYLLSKSYLFVPSAIMYVDGNLHLKSLDDLAGLRYAGMKGSKQLNDVKSTHQDIQITETDNMFNAYELMVRGNADVIAEDIHWLKYTAQSYPEQTVHIVAYETEKDLSSQQVMMFRKDNTELANLINEGIDKLKEDGTIDAIENKWIK